MIHVIVNLSRHSLRGAVHTAGHLAWDVLHRSLGCRINSLSSHGEHLLEWSCFLVRKLCKGSKERPSLHGQDLYCSCAVCHGEIHSVSLQCCMDAGHPTHDGMQGLFATYLPSLILSYQSSYPIKPFVAKPFLLRCGKSCALSLSPPHPTM